VCLGILVQASAMWASPAAAQPVDQVGPVVQWNRVLLTIVRTPGAQPATMHPTRSFAIMHAAMLDAVNVVDRRHRFASHDAAVASAAHDVLVALYPTPSLRPALDAALQQSLATLPDDPDRAEGVRIGAASAIARLQQRSHDGADAAPIPYVFGTRPGEYQSTPPNNPKQPQFTHWRFVTPFALARASQFRPGPPPPLTSAVYAKALNEVQSLGIADSPAATVEQATIGRFWNGAIQNYWNEIAQTASIAHRLQTVESARLFALLNEALADAVIAFYDAKYTYNFWRPVSAVRGADEDRNRFTTADPDWLPQSGNTPPDPSYPGAHAVISSAAALVLETFFGSDHIALTVTSESLPSVERTFESFSAARDEASVSRIYAGVHFHFDEAAGERLGRQVARVVIRQFELERNR
jgi:hypothetical protein